MKTPRGATALGTVFLFLALMIILYVVWLYTGGPTRSISHSGPFIAQPPIPKLNTSNYTGDGFETDGSYIGTPTTYEGSYGDSKKSVWDYFFNYRDSIIPVSKDPSPYTGAITLSIGNARTTSVNDEYVVIKVSSKNKTNLTATGWSIQNASNGITAPLGEASAIPSLGDVNVEQTIVLAPDSTMYVVTGRSPKGVSFRTNKCTGYFNQFQRFTPGLRQECPTPQNEMARTPEKVSGNDLCITYVTDIKTCEYRTTSLPGNIGSSCQDFILNTLNYSGCIRDHKADPDFYKNEWRVYLKRDQELYSNTHERIRLLDENKKIIAEVSY